MEHELNRRGFLAAAGGALALSTLPGEARGASPGAEPKPGTTILFQGDSITDVSRKRDATGPDDTAGLGSGYPLLLAGGLLARYPEQRLRIFNRGISGNTVPDLQQRWRVDTLDLQPDLLSILIGVNDLWHKLAGNTSGTVADYEEQYSSLLAGTRRRLPEVKLVILEPFVLRTGAVDARWFPEFDERRAAAARVAARAGARFLRLQSLFDRLTRRAPPEYWLADGVHPTAAGHAAIADLWRRSVNL